MTPECEDHVLRVATRADAAAIAAIYNESIAAGDATMDERIFSAADIEDQLARFGPGEAYVVLERGDGVVVGWGRLARYSDRAGYRFTAETSVYCRRCERGRGYGGRLQTHLHALARTHGYHHLVAKILASNVGSVRFHERFGFTLVGVQREVGFKAGRFIDVAIMQRVV